ncbi:unnamed protein product [Urochloa humidicola]
MTVVTIASLYMLTKELALEGAVWSLIDSLWIFALLIIKCFKKIPCLDAINQHSVVPGRSALQLRNQSHQHDRVSLWRSVMACNSY